VTDRRFWLDEEETLFKETWSSGKYSPEMMSEVFQRSWGSLRSKARELRLDSWEIVLGRVRLEAIRKALNEEHII